MAKNLVDYKDWAPVEHLSGVYFNKVFANDPALIKKPLVIRIENDEPSIFGQSLGFKTEGDMHLLRLILEVISNGKVTSRHSNVVVIDNVLKKIVRFEPLASINSNKIDQFLANTLRPLFKGYIYEQVNSHPQDSLKDIGLCVAFTIKFAYFYRNRSPIIFEGAYDIHRFSKAVKTLYPTTAAEEATDIEFGWGGGLALGLLGGLAIGGAVAAAASPRPIYYSPYGPYHY